MDRLRPSYLLTRRLAPLALVLCGALLASGCAELRVVGGTSPPKAKSAKLKHSGPPPHAPAHGYRHKLHSHGVELRYDSGLGVYVVVGIERLFFQGTLYYRLDGDRWYSGARPEGPWESLSASVLPPGLRKKYGKAHGRPDKPKHGHGPH